MGQIYYKRYRMNFWPLHHYMKYLLIYNDKMDDAAILEFSPFQTSIRGASSILHSDYHLNFCATIYSILALRVVAHPKLLLLKLLISSPTNYLLSNYNIFQCKSTVQIQSPCTVYTKKRVLYGTRFFLLHYFFRQERETLSIFTLPFPLNSA